MTTDIADHPHAAAVERNVLRYDGTLASRMPDPATRREVQTEIPRAPMDGPGIVVFKGALAATVIDQATDAFNEMLSRQRAAGVVSGDHFAKPLANDRIWGALDKLAVARPEVFFDYYANDIMALASQAWLGPNYRVTSALNIVNPAGPAQTAHRDYHLGFHALETAAGYPERVHRLSLVLTLQGAAPSRTATFRCRPGRPGTAAFAKVCPRLPGGRAAPLRGVFRRTLHAIAAEQG